jgi:hypothetical protein
MTKALLIMTLEIAEFRCPTCSQVIGEEEYRRACIRLDKNVEEICKERMQEQEEKHNRELEIKVDLEVEAQKAIILSQQDAKWKNEIAALEKKYEQEIRNKNKEIETAQQQIANSIDEQIKEALAHKEDRHRQREIEFNLQISRIQKQNGELIDQVQKLQQTLDNVPPRV